MLLFLNVCRETFQISSLYITQKVKGVLMWNLQTYDFHMKPKILGDFQICFSVPLRLLWYKITWCWELHRRKLYGNYS